MRIGIIGDALDRQYAGIYFFTKNFIETCVKHDRENEYFIFREKASNNDFDCEEIVIPTLNWLPGYQSVRLMYMIPSKARKLKLDIMIEPAHFGPFNLPREIKRVTVIHDLTPILFRKWHTFNGWFLQKLFLPGIVKRADLIITNSQYTKSDIIRHLGKGEQMIVPTHLGISNIFRPDHDLNILAKYGIFKEYILYQGTLEPRKNLINLIRAYELFRNTNPDRKEQLILSGKKGWKIKEIIKKKYSSEYRDDIILLGYVSRNDMPALFTGAKVFAYPSYYEGFGLPVLEAMACGTPIVTSNTSSLPEVAGKYALYFDPNNIEEISKSLTDAIHISPDILKEQIEYAAKFTWVKTSKRVLQALKRFE